MRHQTYGYLPSRRALAPLDRYQIILLAQGCYLKALGRESNPRPSGSQVQRPDHNATRPNTYNLRTNVHKYLLCHRDGCVGSIDHDSRYLLCLHMHVCKCPVCCLTLSHLDSHWWPSTLPIELISQGFSTSPPS